MNKPDSDLLRLAIAEAQAARDEGNEPFGAVIAKDGELLASARNTVVTLGDPTRHAELEAIRACCEATGRSSFEDCTLYCSTEPCMMCSGAIHWARIGRVVYSVSQPMLHELSGGRPKPRCEDVVNVGRRRVEVVGPLLGEEGLAVLEGFVFGGRSVCQRG